MWKLEKNGDPKYFIEGPGRLTSALETLKSPKLSPLPPTTHESKEKAVIVTTASHLKNNVLSCRTIVASDNDVSNGFVKDGKALPYVFEATESGLRKRSNKILPVCGVCGKKFVCVTTMKRHLVTHTGEKPFSCKVCGKQYTQKGNLRVHERTHRNDRPFECNICHQKFYRKEPMQKHQWRQHAIVHFKTRPLNAQKEEEVPLPVTTTHAEEVVSTPALELIHKPSSNIDHPLPMKSKLSEECSTPTYSSSSVIDSGPLKSNCTTTIFEERDKPCLKHKMKLAQAYLREQRERGENISSSGRDIVGLLNLSLKEEVSSASLQRTTTISMVQCDGCRVSFKDTSALNAHNLLMGENESLYKCCVCGQEFNQRSLLKEHQLRVHLSKNYVVVKPAMTFTMQELIDRGVERSMMKQADIGRFDEERSINLSLRSPSPPSQPLDLSPAKSLEQSKQEIIHSRASNHLLNNRLYREDIQETPSSPSPLSPVYKKQKIEERAAPEETKDEEHKKKRSIDHHSQEQLTSPVVVLGAGSINTTGSTHSINKLKSWKTISPYIKSDLIRSSDQMRLTNMERNRPQDGRTV
ncbi:uncharacterized protein [Lepeophtheirus salmonis]|uniref:uncharacterized protein n=1 Tax=Lepeophtheirus salmonis TaxID=72036 RepID=UPI001AE4FD73|nr:zinc finger protein 337-like [Lepeophtheirus salmonis]XP_040580721.1 zinc finger protein 337-like [Lepeophtheirus salmonis]